MLEKIEKLKGEISTAVAGSLEDVEQLRIKYLSKKGSISALMADFRNVPAEHKKEVGQKVNELKNLVTEKIFKLINLLPHLLLMLRRNIAEVGHQSRNTSFLTQVFYS